MISLSVSLLLTLVVAAVILLRGPEERTAADPVAAKSETSEPQKSASGEIPNRESADLPANPEPEPRQSPPPEPVAAPRTEPESAPQPEPAPALQPEPEPEPVPQPVPEPAPEPAPEQRPQPQGSLPAAEEDWPEPESSEVEAANEPRRYNWVPGAIMALTVDDIGIHNAPVMGDDSQQSLDKGIVHVPETSLPWTRAPQRNVYLAAHVLGWPGTGSRLIFHNLDQLGDGDEILLKDRRGERYRYKVTEKLVVDPDERWVMGQELNRDMVTLQTCTGPNFSKRLIVRADRI